MFANDPLQQPAPKELTDPRSMRALAHPTRLTLLELITREGSLTATRAAELLGQSSASASFHLRQLAKYGFVEEAGSGRGRERPWRAASLSHHWSAFGNEPESGAAADVLSAVVVEHDLIALMRWLDEHRTFPAEWRHAASISDSLLYVTPEELEELGNELAKLAHRHLERTADPAKRPADARPVRLFGAAFPIPPTTSGN